MLVGIGKFGFIGSSFVDALFDERADREDVDVRVVGSGSKMGVDDCMSVMKCLLEFDLDCLILVSPNPSMPGPAKARELAVESGLPCIVVSDYFGVGSKGDVEDSGLGYIYVKGDPLIGARREFLDFVEMADFNSNVLKVLSLCGSFRKLQLEIDRFVGSDLDDPYLPRCVITPEKAVEDEFSNPYAESKAIAALEIANRVAEINHKVCFKINDRERYVRLASSSHEMLKKAAVLAEEAREIEKKNDSVRRTPHKKDGGCLEKKRLHEDI
ncbi:Coenzyme F420-dependent N5N10-methenyltetrahydromethanopterin dehydrogenase Mtd [Methanonatronarchaeum thermophilum]|uniref:F420-dependent methylenetetrahydromethanopterin dehydrogenase n=1 Tax=Methanonatronarchaeum thermophilum TaxID=1927129 RepID=A0A1Y3GBB2_9EURY|nr:F420-dependent methylenetetrahydromethanopterin dehydrogenase [Methanonatronarchaeum thermophilum]OUJ18718.1 Coenzyme F420-dependent N5N10-methenyltetrahydromethanopterin dehydrogenase Mtd [Methanonatronarchaeum thermophilum]